MKPSNEIKLNTVPENADVEKQLPGKDPMQPQILWFASLSYQYCSLTPTMSFQLPPLMVWSQF